MSDRIFGKLFLILGLVFFSTSQVYAQDITLLDPYAEIKNKISETTEILSFETRRISAKYPSEVINKAGMNYPGYRGPGQLVVYYPGFDKTTGTNEFGMEAVVEDGIVVKLTGANSIIPKNGYVISGHGSSKTWIKKNLHTGSKVIIDGNTVIVYTTPESYVFRAKEKIEEAEEFIKNARRSEKITGEDKKSVFYLKKAVSELKKAEKLDNTEYELQLSFAQSSIRFSNAAIKYALPYLSDEFKGVWVRPVETNTAEIRKTLDNMQKTGIKEIFLETYFHGYTIFPSRTMKKHGFTVQNPKFAGLDILSAYINEAHKRDMKVHVWFESFYTGNQNPLNDSTSILATHPEWGNKNLANYDSKGYVKHKVEHNGYFLDPANPAVRDFLVELISEITSRYKIDGVNLDYTRYPNAQRATVSNYEQSNWGYTDYARKEFMELYEIDPIEIKQDSALWKKWSEYRRDKLFEYVKAVRGKVSEDILLSAVIFPDYQVCLETKQQDWAKWSKEGLVDAVTPLILTSDNELFESILKEVKSRISNKTDVMTGLFVGFLEGEPEDLLRQISVSRALKSKGIILFDWAHLAPKYKAALKHRVFLPK